MSGSTIGGVVGGVIGWVVPGGTPMGAQWGWMIGSAVALSLTRAHRRPAPERGQDADRAGRCAADLRLRHVPVRRQRRMGRRGQGASTRGRRQGRTGTGHVYVHDQLHGGRVQGADQRLQADPPQRQGRLRRAHRCRAAGARLHVGGDRRDARGAGRVPAARHALLRHQRPDADRRWSRSRALARCLHTPVLPTS